MELGKSLIDKASKVCGNDSKLAKTIGVNPVVIYELRSGKRTMSPATAAELADIAGEDAREAAIQAVVEASKGTRREKVLRAILGKVPAAGVAAMLVFSYNVGSILNGQTAQTTAKVLPIVNNLYIVLSRLYAVARVTLGARHVPRLFALA